MSTANRRLMKEYHAITSEMKHVLRNVSFDDSSCLIWTAFIVPETPPYNQGAFKIKITFPSEYPFKPPKLAFKTPIYHPNIDEKGELCLPIINPENWKPARKVENVIQALIELLESPDVDHALRPDLAEQYRCDVTKFMKTADDHTRKYAEIKPSMETS